MSTIHPKKILLSSMIGNILEWYDFILYGYFVVILGQLFFPQAEPLSQLLASWGIFWTGFLARPLGSILFGYIGDKYSRKHALTLSIFLMAIPTTLMGLLPTYETVGIAAPILLILLRTLQGLAIGGEYSGSMVFLVEHASPHQRGMWGSWGSLSAVLGVIAGSAMVSIMYALCSEETLLAWGWRVPFLISLLGSIVGIYIRLNLSDPAVYLALKARKNEDITPLRDLMTKYKSKIVTIFMLDVLTAIGFFIIALFLVTYLRSFLHYQGANALLWNSLNLFLLGLMTLIGGRLSDKFGRKTVMIAASTSILILAYPMFSWIQTNQTFWIFLAQAILSMVYGLYFGVIPSMLSEMLPTEVRYSGVSIGHNLCLGIVGGGTPLLATKLISLTHNLYVPAYLMMGAACISLITLLFLENKRERF